MPCGKVYGDFGNFAVGADAHGRTPDADPGGDDAGHILNADHTAGILPADACGEVAWKELSVMGVAGKHEIGMGISKGIKFRGLVIDDDDRAIGAKRGGQFLCRAADDAAFLFAGGIKPSDQVKRMIDQKRFILKQCDAGVLKKLIHARIASDRVAAGIKGESGEDQFVNVVVAPAGKASVRAVN